MTRGFEHTKGEKETKKGVRRHKVNCTVVISRYSNEKKERIEKNDLEQKTKNIGGKTRGKALKGKKGNL